MRARAILPLSAFTLVILAVPSTRAAERAWKTGTWAASTGERTYLIETDRDILTTEAQDGDTATLTPTPGTAVQYAVEQQTVYVLDSAKVEHALRLKSSAAKYSGSYGAMGAGHYVTAVEPGGTRVTLEDGSHWDIDPRVHFEVANWQIEDLISVRRSDEPGFAFWVDNTSRDTGALANRLVR